MTGGHDSFIGKRGFTLIELVMVMFVLALVAAVAAPTLRGFIAGRRATDAAEQVLGLARWARSQAISEGKTYQLNVDVRQGQISVSALDAAGVMQPVESTVAATISMPQGQGGVKLDSDLPADDSGMQIARFYATGRTDPGRITLTDDRNVAINIVCDSASETFHIQSGDK